MPDSTHFTAAGHLFWQFAILGSLSVTLNTCADLTVAAFAGLISDKLRANRALQRRKRVVSVAGMIGLGVYAGCSGSAHSR
jgi:threonine/homoserine/homoserine lactone efflux protein